MPSSAPSNRAEIADVGRLARRLLDRAVETARTENHQLRRLLLDHLGPDAPYLPTVSATWPAYEHVNVQVGLDAWLAGDPGGRRHEVYGITGIGFMRHMEIVGIGDFLLASGDSAFRSAGAGGVMTEALPSGPDGQTRACSELWRLPGTRRQSAAGHGAPAGEPGPAPGDHPPDRRRGPGSPGCRP